MIDVVEQRSPVTGNRSTDRPAQGSPPEPRDHTDARGRHRRRPAGAINSLGNVVDNVQLIKEILKLSKQVALL
jgi:hypothetical protein